VQDKSQFKRAREQTREANTTTRRLFADEELSLEKSTPTRRPVSCATRLVCRATFEVLNVVHTRRWAREKSREKEKARISDNASQRERARDTAVHVDGKKERQRDKRKRTGCMDGWMCSNDRAHAGCRREAATINVPVLHSIDESFSATLYTKQAVTK
jgi:hypothetical protein